MFRVLSDEEAKRVVRWKAPDIGNNPLSVVNTQQIVRPAKSPPDMPMTPILHNKPVDDAPVSSAQSAPAIQKAVSVDESVYKPTTARVINSGDDSRTTANLALSNPSADMLQASYDDGYSRGYAEGNAALHQQSLKELQSIVTALTHSASEYRNEALENEVLAMSLKIAGLLVHREIEVDRNALCQLVRLGLEQLPAMTADTKRVYLHPLDAHVVRELLDQNTNVQIVDDAGLDRGQCRIEAGASVVHAGVDDWLTVLAGQLGLAEYAQPTDTSSVDPEPDFS